MPIHLEVGPRHQRGPFSLVRMLGGETKNDAIAARKACCKTSGLAGKRSLKI
jgi:hypothetical protein